MFVSYLGDGNLTPHFTKYEIRVKSHHPDNEIDFQVVQLAELVRKYSGGRPVVVNSGSRDYVPAGGVQNSAHMQKRALDLGLDALQMKVLQQNLYQFLEEADGLAGLGVYPWGVHIDTWSAKVERYWLYMGNSYPLRHWSEGVNLWLTPTSTPISVEEVDSVDSEIAADQRGFPSFMLVAFVVIVLFIYLKSKFV